MWLARLAYCVCFCVYVTFIHIHTEERKRDKEYMRDHMFETNENNLRATSKICFTKYLLCALLALTVTVFLGFSTVCEMVSLRCTCITYSPIFSCFFPPRTRMVDHPRTSHQVAQRQHIAFEGLYVSALHSTVRHNSVLDIICMFLKKRGE